MPVGHVARRTHARQRRHAEAAGVAKAVEHMLEAQALRVVGKPLAAVALAEQEFDRPDSRSGGEITGIAIEHHNLRPGETTSVYVIRRGGSR